MLSSSLLPANLGPLQEQSSVFIVDDDADVRRSISLLVKSIGLPAKQFASPLLFLKHFVPQSPGCLVLDMRMPGMSGLELQKELTARNIQIPIIFISAHGEVSNVTTAMRAGAIDFLRKPFSPQMLVERINEAIALDQSIRALQQQQAEIRGRIAKLTEREREVMQLLSEGESTKSIASRLDISPKTVDNHRTKVLDKMGVDNPTQLAHLIQTAHENINGLCDDTQGSLPQDV